MAQDKVLSRLEAKIDALLDKAGIDRAQFEASGLAYGARSERALTPQEQEAIDNAPDAPATVPPAEAGPRVTAQNAPDTRSSVPKKVETKPASEAKGKG